MIAVMGHNFTYTDTDSLVGSMLLASILRMQGKEVEPVLINPDALQETTERILRCIGNVERPALVGAEYLSGCDIALVDHNDPNESYGRLGIEREPLICIDHHADAGYPAKDKRIVRVGAACTILVDWVRQIGMALTDQMARAATYAIVSDTKGFMSRKTSRADIEAVEYLMSRYRVGNSLEQIKSETLINTDVKNKTTEQLLASSLKEYCDGRLGIASIEVLDDAYEERIPEILQKGWQMGFSVYAFMVLKQHTGETLIYYFDRSGGLPQMERHNTLISRGQELAPKLIGYMNQATPLVR